MQQDYDKFLEPPQRKDLVRCIFVQSEKSTG